ncbi:hypothetical protein SmJEL517_g01441 [Synchytrium microbalum]|uniref:Enoyl reductase (ER) domain-containing protein n=1 Tax=Synchytrium microbalum TaxID=1806994 RepID=A0A507C5B0_9FUNG|nr:uncharacterized protein SmJEL517_g01441 [Synchytrium microbalum]TPX36177.1 hypothetical protein SmJEL517_g01441 [Synchytrium microbalum]
MSNIKFPMKTKAAVLNGFNQKFEVREIEIEGLKQGECLVKVAAAGICHSDLHVIKGDWAVPGVNTLPQVLGHEGSGIIVKNGPGVTKVQEGDHCVLIFKSNCGLCDYCQTGKPMLCNRYNVRPPGTLLDGTPRFNIDGKPCYHMAGVACFSEYTVMSEEQLMPISKDIPLDRAALVGCSVMTGIGAAVNTAKVEPGSTVCVVGAGGVGLNILQGAKLCSASMIIAVDIVPLKLQLAKQFGATHVIDGSKVTDVVAEVKKLTGGRGVDFSFDAIGNKTVMEQIFAMIKPGGTAVEVGISPINDTSAISSFALAMQEKTLKGSFYGSARPRVDMARILDLYQKKQVKIDELVSERIPLEDINRGFDLLRAGAVART